jgi:hypothetical protein
LRLWLPVRKRASFGASEIRIHRFRGYFEIAKGEGMERRNDRIFQKTGKSPLRQTSDARRVGDNRNLHERRGHQRYRLKKGAFAMLQARSSGLDDIAEMSMGEIGMAVIKSKPVKMGEIKNVSHSGLSFHYPAGRANGRSARRIDIVLAENAIWLKGLEFKTIADTEVDEGRPFAPIKTNQQQIQFTNLTAGQRAILDRLIKTHADIAPKVAESGSAKKPLPRRSDQPAIGDPRRPPIGGANGEA